MHHTTLMQGAFVLQAWNGVFSNTVMLEFWTYVGEFGCKLYNACTWLASGGS